MDIPSVKMVQISSYHWKLLSPIGIVIKDDILVNNAQEAKEYAIAYISSFEGWTCEIEEKPKSTESGW